MFFTVSRPFAANGQEKLTVHPLGAHFTSRCAALRLVSLGDGHGLSVALQRGYTMKKALFLATALAMAPVTSVSAIEVLETKRTNPSGNCDGARPVDRDALRIRPLALVNEYSNNIAFATCAFLTNDPSVLGGVLGISTFGTNFTNLSNATVTVTCTGVIGEEGSPVYEVKSVEIGPMSDGTLAWNSATGLLFSQRLSFSCALPPQVGLTDNWVTTVLSIL